MAKSYYVKAKEDTKYKEENINKNFSYALINYISDQESSAAQISKMAGLSSTTVLNYVSGYAAPTLGKAILIANALDFDINDMTKGKSLKKPVTLQPINIKQIPTELLVKELQSRLNKTKSLI